jgi:hypothetical protein
MEAALQQPLNERFVLLSEACIPLYPATLVWAQLMTQFRSRIHACAVLKDPVDEGRRMTYRCVRSVPTAWPQPCDLWDDGCTAISRGQLSVVCERSVVCKRSSSPKVGLPDCFF